MLLLSTIIIIIIIVTIVIIILLVVDKITNKISIAISLCLVKQDSDVSTTNVFLAQPLSQILTPNSVMPT